MPVILTQTDTTVGFLSQDASKLYEIKSRSHTKPFVKVYNNLATFTKDFHRVPKKYKKKFRRAKKTTFIIQNQALRIAPTKLNSSFLRKYSWQYSTSANESGKKFLRAFCEMHSDVIIEDKEGLFETTSSRIYKINKHTRRRLR